MQASGHKNSSRASKRSIYHPFLDCGIFVHKYHHVWKVFDKTTTDSRLIEKKWPPPPFSIDSSNHSDDDVGTAINVLLMLEQFHSSFRLGLRRLHKSQKEIRGTKQSGKSNILLESERLRFLEASFSTLHVRLSNIPRFRIDPSLFALLLPFFSVSYLRFADILINS